MIDLDDSTLPLSFIPIAAPRITIQCGPDGRRGDNSNELCIIRGGGKRSTKKHVWNTNAAGSYKDGGHAILGGGNLAQIYVYGDDAYEVTLKGLTLDNSVSRGEVEMYGAFVQEFGVEALWGGDDDDLDALMGSGGSSNTGSAASSSGNVTVDTTAASSTATTSTNSAYANNSNVAGSNEVKQMLDQGAASPAISYEIKESQSAGNRNMQSLDAWNTFDTTDPITGEDVEAFDNIEPAQRYASIAVRGGGYGDDPGPRIITIQDCHFTNHRGYVILVSPGIQLPEMPKAPEVDLTQQSTSSEPYSGQPHNYGNTGYNMNSGGNRRLNLLEGNNKFITQDGSIKYFDNSAAVNYLDGRRVKIVGSEFVNNNAVGDKVAGLITSAYSITLSNCSFKNNSAKTMVYVYNNKALIESTIFAQNTVQASTIVLKSPVDSKPVATDEAPTHLVEKSCFLGSKVGMSNVLVTDMENTGFGQRDNHATGTEFSWESKCQGTAAEESGEDCLERGVCDGTCVEFTADRCLAENMDESNQEDFGGFNFFMWSAGSAKEGLGVSLVGLIVVTVGLTLH